MKYNSSIDLPAYVLQSYQSAADNEHTNKTTCLHLTSKFILYVFCRKLCGAFFKHPDLKEFNNAYVGYDL